MGVRLETSDTLTRATRAPLSRVPWIRVPRRLAPAVRVDGWHRLSCRMTECWRMTECRTLRDQRVRATTNLTSDDNASLADESGSSASSAFAASA